MMAPRQIHARGREDGLPGQTVIRSMNRFIFVSSQKPNLPRQHEQTEHNCCVTREL